MTQVYRTLRVAPSDGGVLGVVIDAPPMNLMTRDLARGVRGLEGRTESGGVPHANDNDPTCPDPDYR